MEGGSGERGGGRIKDTLHTVHRVKGRPRSVVAGTVFSHGSLTQKYIYKNSVWGWGGCVPANTLHLDHSLPLIFSS